MLGRRMDHPHSRCSPETHPVLFRCSALTVSPSAGRAVYPGGNASSTRNTLRQLHALAWGQIVWQSPAWCYYLVQCEPSAREKVLAAAVPAEGHRGGKCPPRATAFRVFPHSRLPAARCGVCDTATCPRVEEGAVACRDRALSSGNRVRGKGGPPAGSAWLQSLRPWGLVKGRGAF